MESLELPLKYVVEQNQRRLKVPMILKISFYLFSEKPKNMLSPLVACFRYHRQSFTLCMQLHSDMDRI